MTTQDALTRLLATGTAAYSPEWAPNALATAPGRLELLGNHVDYNGGLVLAAAIDRVVRALAGPSSRIDGSFRLLAPDVSGEIATIGATAPPVGGRSSTTPTDYLTGIIQALHEANVPVRDGLDIVVAGDVPVGFGMSSSAALCVSLTMLLAERELSPHQVVSIARRAEHITGAPVGAMDQSASVAGGVILFDGGSAGIEQLTPELGDHVFAVANSGVHHALGESAYPDRVRESLEALRLIQSNTDLAVDHLGEIPLAAWERIAAGEIAWLEPMLRARVQHIVTEVDRVRQGVDAIEAQAWDQFGALMSDSGRSSATAYDISHPVVEELVTELHVLPGVLGARMMGGGEGGPALALVHRDVVDDVRAALSAGFFSRHELDPEDAFEVCAFGPGATVMPLTSQER